MADNEKEILEEDRKEQQAADAEAPNNPEDMDGETDGCQECESGTAADSGEEDEVKEEKKGFGKSRKKDKKEDVLKARIEELEDKVVRQMAEFENYRKRTEKEKTAMFEVGAKSVVEKILPIVDNFERGLAAIPDNEKASPFADGMNMIYKQLMTELEGIGVKPIEAVGMEFDPDFHNAVMQVENDELESGTVAQELQKGYMYRETVVRHSMVAVVQ